ncbi:MAG: argininosuccinate lyase, partial [Gammaproteobacteria bacterium]
DLTQLELAELRRFSEAIEQDVFPKLELRGSVDARDHAGGTAPRQVRLAAERMREHVRLVQEQ